MKTRAKVGLLLIVLIVPLSLVHADYVLPYPSILPGSKLYKISRLIDMFQGYWYWGNIAQTKYSLAQSDAALVESKTLMEYKQYLLGSQALERSNDFFLKIPSFLESAYGEGKDITSFIQHLGEATNAHLIVLQSMRMSLPNDSTWRPEDGEAQYLPLQHDITKALEIRTTTLLQLREFHLCTQSLSSLQSFRKKMLLCQKTPESFIQQREQIGWSL